MGIRHGFDVSMDNISRAPDNEVLIVGKYFQMPFSSWKGQ
jgi:hypothetical protein